MPLILFPTSASSSSAEVGVRSMLAFWMGGAAMVPPEPFDEPLPFLTAEIVWPSVTRVSGMTPPCYRAPDTIS